MTRACRCWVAAVAAAAVAPAAAGAVPSKMAGLPFAPGEQLSYEVTLLGVRAGEAQLRVEDGEGDRPLKLMARGRSVGPTEAFFKLRQSASCLVADDLSPVQCRFTSRNRSSEHRRELLVDRQAGVAREKLLHDGEPRESKIELGDGGAGIQEALTGVYLLRSRLPAEGQAVRFRALRRGRPITVEARAGELSSVDTPAGTFLARAVALRMLDSPVKGEAAAGTVWITEDVRRLPVRLTLDAAVGTLEARLTAAEGTLPAAAAR